MWNSIYYKNTIPPKSIPDVLQGNIHPCNTAVFACTLSIPLSLAEFFSVGRTNSPRMANLVLCARTAHQDGFVGNAGKFRHPECFFSGQVEWAAFSGYSFGLLQKSGSPAGRDPQCLTKAPSLKLGNELTKRMVCIPSQERGNEKLTHE